MAFEHPARQIAFQDYADAVMDAERRLKLVEEQIFSLLPEWTPRPVVDALQAKRGIALINAVALVTEAGDFTRFANRRRLMVYFGMVWASDRTASPPGAGTSPRPATRMPGARWPKAPRLTE